MPAPPSRSRVASGVAGFLILLYLVQGFAALSRKSPTYDETGDIAAGLSYLQTSEVRANLQHPPLLKLVTALPLFVAGYRLPETPAVRGMLDGRGGERTAGSELLASGGVDRPLMLARIPMLLCAALLGLAIFLWGRELAGEIAALCALFLYVLDPNVMAHSYLATMDMGLALFATLFFFLLWRYRRDPVTRSMVLCGIAMGLMLATKFSALALVPVAAVVVGFARWRQFLGMCGIAAITIQALYLSPGGLFLYQAGLSSVNQDHNPDYLVFLNGALEHGFIGYFPLAWFWKEPLATLGLGLAGAYFVARKTSSERWFLLTPPAVLLAAHMAFADDLGFRYLLPALPFAHLLGGIAAARLMSVGWGRGVAAALGLWILIPAVALYPDQLSYFNEAACLPEHPGWISAAGGTRCGPLRLDDSNVDWGQGLPQLREWLTANAAARPVKLAYFGSFPSDAYVPGAEAVDLSKEPGPGLYAISAHFVARTEWAKRREPLAIAGHAFYLYEVK